MSSHFSGEQEIREKAAASAKARKKVGGLLRLKELDRALGYKVPERVMKDGARGGGPAET